MSDDNEERLDVITAILPPLLHSMEALIFLGRYLHPPQLTQLIDHVGTPDTVLRTALADFRKVDWPDRLIDFSRRIGDAGGAVCEAFEGLRTAESEQEGMAAARAAEAAAAEAEEQDDDLFGLRISSTSPTIATTIKEGEKAHSGT